MLLFLRVSEFPRITKPKIRNSPPYISSTMRAGYSSKQYKYLLLQAHFYCGASTNVYLRLVQNCTELNMNNNHVWLLCTDILYQLKLEPLVYYDGTLAFLKMLCPIKLLNSICTFYYISHHTGAFKPPNGPSSGTYLYIVRH